MRDNCYILPETLDTNIQIFMPSASAATNWHTWLKPRNATMMNIFALSGGGGGGGGFADIAGNARGGGGGGGSSGIMRVTIPLAFIPDVLYVQAGAGGLGVRSGGGVAGSGLLSYVSVAPSTNTMDVLCISGAVAPTGGGTGTGAAAGGAGVAGTIPTLALSVLGHTLGHVGTLLAGQVGFAGGVQTGAVGGAGSFALTGIPTMGGTGGAGVTTTLFDGGLITATATGTFISDRRPQVATGAGVTGASGGYLGPMSSVNPFWSYCGMGGAAGNAVEGGNGGSGGPGSGGGGGAGGIAGGGLNGRGGDGGPGMVVITCW